MRTSYVLGLDVGPPGEPTGFAILERPAVEQSQSEYEYHLRHIERFAAGTSYPAIISTVANRVIAAGVTGSPLVVDQTAVGHAFIERCWRASVGLNVQALCVTAGQAVLTAEDRTLMVPKRDLVIALQLALQSRRLKIAPELPQASLLTSELAGFRLRSVPVGEMAMVEWREGRHDDLVFAVALTIWFAERNPPFWRGSITVGGGSKYFKHVSFRTHGPASFREAHRRRGDHRR